MIIGICGKSGSGKSSLAQKIVAKHKSAIHLNIDKVGHNVLKIAEVKNELVKCYGEIIVGEDGINRKKLGEIVFNSKNEMDKLTDITWKYMQIEIDKILDKNIDKIIILDWLLLPVSKYFEMCDIKILLDIEYEIRKKRAIERDNITEETFDLREKASFNYDKSTFDYIIEKDNEDEIKRMVEFI